VFQEEQKERVKIMKHYSITVKIDNPVADLLICGPVSMELSRGNIAGCELVAITKESEEQVFCVEFCVNTHNILGREVERNVLVLLQAIVVGL
jgi:hypothetical protein